MGKGFLIIFQNLQIGVILAVLALVLYPSLPVLLGELADFHQTIDGEVASEVEQGLVGTDNI